MTRSLQVKKERKPKVYVKKQPTKKKRGRQLILQEDSEDTDTEEEPKKIKATGKKEKSVGEIS